MSTLCHWVVLYLDHRVIFRVSSIPPTTLATPSGLSTTSITASPSTSLPSASPAGAGNSTQTTGSSKSKNVAPIVGGVIGVVVLVIATIIAIILWRRRSPKSIPTNETEKVLPKAVPAVQLGSVQPFVLHPSNASPVDISGPNIAEVSPYTLSPVIGSATQASLLPKKFAHGHPVDTGDASLSPSASNTVPARTELLRQERERINREIAALENRSATSDSRNGGSSYGTDSSSYPIMASAPPIPIVGTINEQLASLREQIRQIEQVYGPRGLAVMSDEPPPVYDGLPSGAIIGGSRPLPNVRPLGESSTSALVPRPNPEVLCPADGKEG